MIFLSRVRKSVLTALFLALYSITVFAQNEQLQIDLAKSFKNVELVRLGNAEFDSFENSNKLMIKTLSRIVELNLYPHDLRAVKYIAEETGLHGQTKLERTANTTFRGSVEGENGSAARFSIEGKNIEGYFESGGTRYYIQPAKMFSKQADDLDFVVYRSGDLSEYGELHCEDNLISKIETGKRISNPDSFLTPQTLRTVEIATEADFELYQAFGNSSQTVNNEILSLLNMVEGIYESELNLTFTVVYQHSWSSATGYIGATRSLYLNGFKDFWNLNRTSGYPTRDAAFLFSGRTNFSGQGQAFLATICSSPLSAYAFTGFINSMEANRILMAHEIGHVVGANHAEENVGCGNTIMNVNLSNVTPFTFCSGSRAEISNHVAVNGSCLAQQVSSGVRFDFDGDRRSDVGVFRPSNGVWYINSSGGGFNIFQFGMSGDKPVSADYDGDGKSDGAVYRSGAWYRLMSATNTFDAISFGLSNDIPAPADFDGDGKADIGVFRPSNGTWYILRSVDGSFSVVQFGTSGDVPVAADYDGDGKSDINVFRPSNGVWYRLNSSNNSFYAAQFGQNGDQAQNGDFDGDGKADLAVWRTSNGAWYSLSSSNGGFVAIGFGLPTDIPVAADYDGDARTDMAVFRPSDGVWHWLSSGSDYAYSTIQFGIETDIPVQAN